MDKSTLITFLTENPKQFQFEVKETGIQVKNLFFETDIFFPNETITKATVNQIIHGTHQGKNIEHITRVTGYFSKVHSWNKGKVSELINRHRTPIT
jgi:hypothetical protein